MSAIYKTQFQAWSCKFSLELIEPKSDPKHIVLEMQDTLRVYDETFSRFRENSVISRLNRGETVASTDLFATILSVATDLSKKLPAKYFNPHVNLTAHGYEHSFEQKDFQPSQSSQYALIPFPDGIEIEDDDIRLREGVNIDFGAFLKGYLAEHLADMYQQHCRGIIVNFGGDLTVRGKDTHTNAFRIGIYNPITHQDEIILLDNQSLSTSGIYKRKWITAGDTKHHILDPSTNQNPEIRFVSISFWGNDAALCDALSTAAFMASEDTWKEWKKQFSDIEYLAITPSGAVHSSLPLNS